MTDSIRVLHVDDDPTFTDMVSSFLEREDDRLHVSTATSVEEGRVCLADTRIDCVVSDYDMPNKTGIEFLEEVRTEYPDLPFILFTSKGSEEIASDAISAGATDYLHKTPGTEQYELLANRIINTVERYHAQTNYHQIFESSPDGIVIHDPADGAFTDMNVRYAEMFGYEREELLEAGFDAILPDDPPYSLERAQAHVQEAIEHGSRTFEWPGVRKDGEQFWAEIHLTPIQLHGRDRVLAAVREITDRKQREQAIQALHDTTHAIWEADSPDTIAEIVVEAARDILDMPANGVLLYDDDGDCLRPVAATDRITEIVGDLPTFERGEGLAWEVFETGDPQMYDDVSTVPGRLNPETEIRSEMILPLGEHGVFLVGSPQPAVFDETDRSLIRTLATHVTSALDQIERERRLTALQECTRTLMHTPTREDTAQAAVETAHDILNSPSSGVHLLNDDEDALAPVAFVDTIRSDFESPTYERDVTDDPVSTLIWETFESQEPLEIDDTRSREQLPEDSPIRSAIIHPLDGYGVFLVTAATPNAFTTTDKSFIEIVAVSLTTALDRVQRELSMRERERELEQQNERLEEFASIVSHDLRNPLNVAQGHIELAGEASESTHLEAAATALERSQALIDDVLTLAREGQVVGDVEAVSLPHLIEACWETVSTADATLHAETEQTIYADRSRLQELLENLIRNAIEHGSEGVTVTVGDLADGFYVADDGPGIPEEERESVFEAGYSTNQDGTGFGLNIVKQVADAHDWEVRVTEGSQGGARFEITGVETE